MPGFFEEDRSRGCERLSQRLTKLLGEVPPSSSFSPSLLPALYSQLDPMQAERFERLNFITTDADAKHLMTVRPSGDVPSGVAEVAELRVPAVTRRIDAIVKGLDLGWLGAQRGFT
ncbi:hypothetical protein FB45DRAFT_1031982 [Roridomyces roridus]|uniref:Uncharacterized protein n=1 Tax=Roridomyces roridus TaxID=1738132 RepID=A0AAD7BIQ0_9AGAR|nr:hypothetical protein FB45DRAFT_1031982 [Roridomyces roridus]